MDESQKQQLRMFINNPAMRDAVVHFLTDEFLVKRDGLTVNEIAAQTIAYQLLQEGIRNMKRKTKVENTQNRSVSPV